MQLVFADDELPTTVQGTIFLAGPNPRYKDGDPIQHTWRHDAVKLLQEKDFIGHVFIPMPKGSFYGETVVGAVSDYDHQITWEDEAMARADVLMFYVDRTAELQGLTTNIEFGRYLESGRMLYGRPDTALNVRYLDEQVKVRGGQVSHDHCEGEGWNPDIPKSLQWLVNRAINRVGAGAVRHDGECLVPLLFWKSPQFQDWYKNTVDNIDGNRLDGFKTKTVITFKDDTFLFGFAAWVSVYIAAEQRNKSNEWIFSRTHTSYVAPYYVNKAGKLSFVLVREFRSPANNPRGYVYELPGGSSTDGKDIDPFVNAQKELEEETGIVINDVHRLRFLGNRQTFATFSTNKIFATAIRLTDEEFEQVSERVRTGAILGENEEERIRLFIATEDELIHDYDDYPVDYTTLGIIHLAKQLHAGDRAVINAREVSGANPFIEA